MNLYDRLTSFRLLDARTLVKADIAVQSDIQHLDLLEGWCQS